MKSLVKYSIIIPSWNGGAYLPACVNTIIQQNYSNYELIISDDHSTDGTKEYLRKLTHPKIIILEPPESLSMTEHWEWALSQAKGEWIIFVGQDDGLQPYFFQLADYLVDEAIVINSRTITSERAYFFWKGCNEIYGDIAIAFSARQGYEIRNSKIEMWKCVFGVKQYFELPQMYTNSLFRIDLLEEAKSKLNGKVFVSHPQDANLAAIACSLDNTYIKSKIPLGWIGSSPRSAGMAIASSIKSSNTDLKNLIDLKNDYESKIRKSKVPYHPLAGQFSFNNMAIYFWQSLLQTSALRSAKENSLFLSGWLRAGLLSTTFWEVIIAPRNRIQRLGMFNEILKLNKISPLVIFALAPICLMLLCSYAVIVNVVKICNKIIAFFGNKKMIRLVETWSDSNSFDLEVASKKISERIEFTGWLKFARVKV